MSKKARIVISISVEVPDDARVTVEPEHESEAAERTPRELELTIGSNDSSDGKYQLL